MNHNQERGEWMTNYNERLVEILMAYKRYPYGTSAAPHISGDETKQSITSLTKELVAEAKPTRAVISDDEWGIDRARKLAANSAIDQFEQNLLKALEDK